MDKRTALRRRVFKRPIEMLPEIQNLGPRAQDQ